MTTLSFELPLLQLNDTLSKLESLNTKIKNLNFPIVKITRSNSYYKKYNINNQFDAYLETIRLTLSHKTIIIDNYQFCGSVHHGTTNLIKIIPEMTIPDEYYTKDSFCDHCLINRYRTDTFIFRNDKNEFKQIGRNCLSKFFGVDPTERIKAYEDVYNVQNTLSNYYNYKNNDLYMDIVTVLTVAKQIIKVFGFVKKTQETKEVPSTTKRVQELLFSNKIYVDDFLIQVDFNDAIKLFNWGLKKFKFSTNDFQQKLYEILNNEYVSYNNIGFVVAFQGMISKNNKR
jgi:hypothetical protein